MQLGADVFLACHIDKIVIELSVQGALYACPTSTMLYAVERVPGSYSSSHIEPCCRLYTLSCVTALSQHQPHLHRGEL